MSMVFPHAATMAGARPLSAARPTALFRAAAAYGGANRWTAVNGWAALEAYTDEVDEAAALRAGAGVCDFSVFARYRVEGPDAAAFLERLTTAAASRMAPGDAAPALVCDGQGFVVDFARVARLDDGVFGLVLSKPRARRLRAAAKGFDVAYRDLVGAAAAIAVFGPEAGDALAAAGAEAAAATVLGGDDGAVLVDAGGIETLVASVTVGDAVGAELVFAAEEGLVMWERIMRGCRAARPVGLMALDALRLEGREPRAGADFVSADEAVTPGDKRTPADLGLEALAPLDGTWFNGRAALRRRAGRPPERRLALLACAAPTSPGATVFLDGRRAGRVTSCARSPKFRQTLAFADLEAGPARGVLTVDGAPGADPGAAREL